MYNTETAQEVCSEGFGNNTDGRYWCETLYVTKKGQYFQHGEGGGLSRYAESCGTNCITGSENMELLYEAEAKEIIMKLDPEKAELLFEIEEG